ncbi:hypothetical protein T4B_11665 [Trichinella pseudospiralis]|uniref:Uncharacterized protein n=2 Tax=Trichinella pseudospiralis TaxID=6337 RepID=A0A0V1JRJ4_TRIPS|nr:hypothetical protein T4E_2958 [Trichinella pseudospiralis]KRY73638.1 hypothetical protein T4A_7654 [Trichinella pseudospiralis]KRY89037.1 hypothetical protein T4D_3910 [Trichinella pseudospiralis]KRZ33744.1 hypothetical protein T4B_11665 [Trichinella pseudospiralis]KRZ37575.1 hypothetical protein T4C_10785 [Trichinella pseudospiralis]
MFRYDRQARLYLRIASENTTVEEDFLYANYKIQTRDRPCIFVLVDHHPAAGSFGVGRRHHVDNDRAKHVDQQAGDVDGRAGHGQPKRISHFLFVNFGQRVQHPVLEFVGNVEEHDHRAAG